MSRERRRVFITGASSGIGAGFARHYAERGAVVGLAARRGEVLEEVAQSLPTQCYAYALDVADAAALQHAASDFIARAGVPDLIIANAGVSVGTLTEESADLAAFERVLRTNVMGMANTFSPFIKAMRAARRGTLAGVASVAGVRGLPGAGAYSASKAAAIAYLESLRVELRGTGLNVVTLAPGYIATPMTCANPYPMPFILTVDDAVRRMARAIAAGRSHAVVPWQMAVAAKLLRALPNPVFDALFARAGRKPRGTI